MSDFDVVIVGGGPGGYASALYGASAGLSIAVVEDTKLGGTCLNRGCIPAKALLQAAEVARTVGDADSFGIVADSPTSFHPDWDKVNARKQGVIDRLVGGLGGLLKKRKVTVIDGHGQLQADGSVKVGDDVVRGRSVILATGSAPRSIPGFDIDGERVITSDHATHLPTLPERVAIIGGGVIGVEFASVFTDMGAETFLLEALPQGVLPVGPDPEVAKVLAKALAKRGVTVYAGVKVSPPERTEAGLVVAFEGPNGSTKVEVDNLLIATGRRPVTDGLGLDEAGVAVDSRGFIEIDRSTLLTSKANVYAVGDVIDTPGLAHVAYAEGIVAISCILGETPVPVDYRAVPWVVYAHPEVAWAGLTEAQASDAGHDVVVGKGHFSGNGRAMIVGEAEGIVKVVTERDGPILGVHIVGPWASELISESYLAVNWQALPSDVGHFIHAHPSLSETVGETMLALTGRSLHA
ncbi:MAG: dihydrolipoyl dehydrogenase [Acidimicrobiia bacterium]